ncbi:helix-turn-helix transcriptional regulator [Aquibacillus sp. 3ASR75-11]|uniref:Helix-turn-helix transcriptional regulator n=1 Tax=Terrihalobacillus insolitus TaxID=2950438 RepID=A0A9X3WU20_9BACI|nr:helix-turn-helix transcriptional regulator [Terrihalobacillus insolitus]MDC3424236.1 helix-turn-helix transcriptional regulator [Terrihalobacillus insolitus]
MDKVQFTVEVTKETAASIQEIVNHQNMRLKFGSRKGDKITEEDVIKAALSDYLDLFNSSKNVKSLLSIILEQEGFSSYHIKNRFKEIMKRKGLQQVDIVNMTGISKTNISQIFNNKYPPGLDLFFRIWVALDCPPLNEVIYLDYIPESATPKEDD